MPEPLSIVELKLMREAGRVLAAVLKKLEDIVRPAITTKDIENFFDKYLLQYPDMQAAFKGYSGFPASLCVSINDEVIHGIPSNRKLNLGDLVSVDIGIKYKNLFVDAARSYIVGGNKESVIASKLYEVARASFYEGVKQVKIGNRIGDISYAIQSFVEKHGFSVVRSFVGHGIGYDLHLPPEVPNFGQKGKGEFLKEGMVIAIEPMITVGNYQVYVDQDGWTVKTKDKSLAAHFEQTVAISSQGPWVLTE